MTITAAMVKELRERTGAGMMDCKKALQETDGDMDKAAEWLREKGIAKAAKKSGRIAAEGLTRVATDGNIAVIFEVNSETDFVAKNEQFTELLDKIQGILLSNKPSDMDSALALVTEGDTLETTIANATATIGERISLRRFEVVEKTADDVFGAYMHMGGKISALTVLKGGNDEVAKDIAMQVASMSPQYISRDHMPQEFIDKERQIQTEILNNDESLKSKPENVLKGIVEGRLSKSLQDVSLIDQIYFKDPNQKVAQYLKSNNAEVVTFVRYAVGEGIEKREENFAEEVMNQINK
ncbi:MULTISPECIES: translation elongation factor Ts [Breznakia]|uniref:Elongation factor Ts n=1 Tax=Breznakia blatticola TaxID=1754012 RepID=A0A4R7ZQW8_9FIRM|nr:MULTISPECIES: translation elongation factor Ts [Breznakia]MDH6366731.1 elongation factor Ts [Breznakia sp. PH1-1]MDH6403882.1 elongation factor Ts [Breznakia sp. PF1-11]MDH6411591.1 elongation factor Ts [Breznakia sp. PFB1-11]MDH6413955.1 elongation factor Ts [Breznakia sp. PFB1-14]MDH6416384.1 elongation factor Ts [Breznakia sp. PFB1-4]